MESGSKTALITTFRKKFAVAVMAAGAVLAAILVLSVFGRGLSPSGLLDAGFLPGPGEAGQSVQAASGPDVSPDSGAIVIEDNVQYITSSMTANAYEPIVVQQGIPVKWTLNAPDGTINGCNNAIVISKYNVQVPLQEGDNLIEFTPEESGTVLFTCWMGMIRSKITVAAPGGTAAETGENIQLAVLEEGVQRLTVKLDETGFTPQALVIQRDRPFIIEFKPEDAGSGGFVYFPVYGGGLDLAQATTTPELTAQSDFSFENVDGDMYGYVKVVDSLDDVNLEAVRQDAADFMPAGGSGMGGGGCCCAPVQ